MPPLWIEFVNSSHHDHTGRGRDADHLDDPAWLGQFLRRAGARGLDVRSPATRRRLAGLRSLLLRLAEATIEQRRLAGRDLAALNRLLAARPVIRPPSRADEGYRLELVPTTRGLDGLMHTIAMSFADLLVEGEPSRLRMCDNPDCRWVFIDETRSGNRRWCAPTCGTLIKVREHRRRRSRTRRTGR